MDTIHFCQLQLAQNLGCFTLKIIYLKIIQMYYNGDVAVQGDRHGFSV
ncbi:MAG: hypothetical protein F6K30_22515 [Cyanothece sp. SIO2G6]|nr:hypothetical protein [Cyanothece sp. SIO2G6]